MRQLGVGSQHGAEALAICHQLICDEWASGSLDTPLARIKVDENTVLEGLRLMQFVKERVTFFPKHAAAAGWKHIVDDGDILCHPIYDRSGAVRNPQKTEVLYYLPNLDAATPEWKVEEARLLASVSAVAWEQHPRSWCGTPSVHRGPTLGQSRSRPSCARACPAVPGPADRISSLMRKSWRMPYQPHPTGARPHNPERATSCRNLRQGWTKIP